MTLHAVSIRGTAQRIYAGAVRDVESGILLLEVLLPSVKLFLWRLMVSFLLKRFDPSSHHYYTKQEHLSDHQHLFVFVFFHEQCPKVVIFQTYNYIPLKTYNTDY